MRTLFLLPFLLTVLMIDCEDFDYIEHPCGLNFINYTDDEYLIVLSYTTTDGKVVDMPTLSTLPCHEYKTFEYYGIDTKTWEEAFSEYNLETITFGIVENEAKWTEWKASHDDGLLLYKR